VFRKQLVSKNQSLRGNVFANSFPKNGLYVTVFIRVPTSEHRSFVTPLGIQCHSWVSPFSDTL
jgi:hypothetical protein